MADGESQVSPQTSGEVLMGEPGEEGDGFEGTEMLPDADGIFRRQSQRKKPRVGRVLNGILRIGTFF